ncbi:MAG: TonB-dependent receptor [Gemmatimonadota bacterium]
MSYFHRAAGQGSLPRTILLLGLMLLWPHAVAAQAQPRPGGKATLHGVVMGLTGRDRLPVQGALVTLRTAGETLSSATDSQGRYRIQAPPGGGRLAVHHVGYAPLSLDLILLQGRALRVDLDVEGRPLELAPVAVRVLRPRPISEPPLGSSARFAELRLRALEGGTGLGESGIMGWVRDLPGGDDPDGGDLLLVRGGGRDLRLVLLDGAPVYAPFHMGGVLPSFPAEVLEGAELHVGGAPSRFDGGLAYILDMRTRAPRNDRMRFSTQLDGLSGRVAVESPMPAGGALLAAVRGIHGAQPRLMSAQGTPFGYREGILRGNLPLGSGTDVHFTLFGNRESVQLDLPDFIRDEARWGNELAVLGVRREWGRRTIQGTVSSTLYKVGLPVAQGADAYLSGASRRNRMGVDLEQDWREGTLRAGLSGEALTLRFQGASLSPQGVGATRERTFPARPGQVTGGMVGSYLEVEHPLDAEFHLRAGLRVDHFHLPNSRDGRPPASGLRVSPRAALRWQMAPEATLTLAAGRYHQFTGDAGAPVELALGPFLETSGEGSTNEGQGSIPATPLPVASSTHLVLSLDQRLPRDLRLTLDGFMKRFQNLPGAEGLQTEASGVDVRAMREGPGLVGWLGYSLTWYWSRDGRSREEDFAGRHILSGGLAGPLGDRGVLGVEVSYGSGLPYTSIPVFADHAETLGGTRTLSGTPPGMDAARTGDFPFPTGLEQSFLRVDAELSGRIVREWRGRPMVLRPYLRVLNALDRRDGLFHYFEAWRDPDARSVAHQPILPLLGVEWTF